MLLNELTIELLQEKRGIHTNVNIERGIEIERERERKKKERKTLRQKERKKERKKEKMWNRYKTNNFFDFAQTKFDSLKSSDVICWQGLFSGVNPIKEIQS